MGHIDNEKTLSWKMANTWSKGGKSLEYVQKVYESQENWDFDQLHQELNRMLNEKKSNPDINTELCSGLTAVFFLEGVYNTTKKRERNFGEFGDDEWDLTCLLYTSDAADE